MKTLTCLSELLNSTEIYIIFGGNSLKDFDFKKLDDKPTLACNKCAEAYKADAVISVDPTYINTRREFLKNYDGYVALAYRGTSLGDPTKPNQGILSGINPDYTYWHDKRFPQKMSEDPHILYGTNTGHASINFAVLQGFKKIHALGLDMVLGHWHGGYTHSRQCKDLLSNWAAHLDACKPYLDSIGVEVINYNKESAVRAYEFAEL